MRQVLNLAHQDNTQIKYKITKFSDTQTLIKIEEDFELAEDVLIISRMSWDDIQLIICAVKALREYGVENIHLQVPYFIGARSDRKFEEGSINYLKEVICPIINSLHLKSVRVMDPHSDVLEACLNNFKKISNISLVKEAMKYFETKGTKVCLVSPDAGAQKKIWDVAKQIGISGEYVVTASKHRDLSTGKILNTEISLHPWHADNDMVIIDDICDGGRTFIEIAKAIEKTFPNNRIYLIVTHGIFSNGFDELNNHFTKIFTTNSYRDIDHPLIRQIKLF